MNIKIGEIEELVKKAQHKDKEAINSLLLMFQPLIRTKYHFVILSDE